MFDPMETMEMNIYQRAEAKQLCITRLASRAAKLRERAERYDKVQSLVSEMGTDLFEAFEFALREMRELGQANGGYDEGVLDMFAERLGLSLEQIVDLKDDVKTWYSDSNGAK